MQKTLEDVIREALAVGYDPIELKVRSRAINENNIEVMIAGIHYSVSGNAVNLLTETENVLPEDGNTNSPSAEQAEDNVDSAGSNEEVNGDSGEVEVPEGFPPVPGTQESVEQGFEDKMTEEEFHAKEAENATEVTDPDFVDLDGDHVDDKLQARLDALLIAFDAHHFKPVKTSDNGSTIFGFFDVTGEPITSGTIAGLEQELEEAKTAAIED